MVIGDDYCAPREAGYYYGALVSSARFTYFCFRRSPSSSADSSTKDIIHITRVAPGRREEAQIFTTRR